MTFIFYIDGFSFHFLYPYWQWQKPNIWPFEKWSAVLGSESLRLSMYKSEFSFSFTWDEIQTIWIFVFITGILDSYLDFSGIDCGVESSVSRPSFETVNKIRYISPEITCTNVCVNDFCQKQLIHWANVWPHCSRSDSSSESNACRL